MNEQPKRLLRSWMFVPGDRQRMIDKALSLPVDAIMMDIEDGVAPTEKENARRQIGASLDGVCAQLKRDPSYRTPARFVRVNAVGSERFIEDSKAVVRHGLEGLVVPKVDTVAQIRIVEDELGRAEVARRMPGGTVKLLIAIESPVGLFNAYQLATSSPRIVGLLFGAEDFTREMNLPMRREGEAVDMIYARSHIATAAAAAHVQAVDGVWVDLNDMEGMKRFAKQARRLGMSGISIIHPTQIEDANAAFTPNSEDIEYAQAVVNAFEDARARGLGAIAFRGQLLDYPIVDRARQTLALAKTLGVS
ncbi:MAG TPA: CoA ester lyase [Micropepsaceae bacterium]|nr:CoA ester lyase [Micropepsaceae bacterium]